MSAASTVPRLWPGETVVCLASGPSLTPSDVQTVRGRARVIAVNDAVRLAPWADVLYACDGKWWNQYHGMPTFPGLKYGMTVNTKRYPEVHVLRNAGIDGLSSDPTSLCTGRNSGYQAINLAVHFGAARILLLGYDLMRHGGKSHFFGEHPHSWTPSPYKEFLRHFPTLLKPLAARGIEVVNCSRTTALTIFPQVPIEQALPQALAVAG